MNIPNTMIRNAISRRGGMRSAAAGTAAIMAGGAVVALAMISDAHSRAHRPMARDYCGWIMVGESRSTSLSASAAPSLVSTVA